MWDGKGYKQDSVFFNNPTYVLGYPITEPYWINRELASNAQTVLVQLFERRALTYTPTNPEGSKVEMGNVGQHYYNWRYIQNGDHQPAPETLPVIGPFTTFGWGGKGILQGQDFQSRVIGKTMSYQVFLPPDYNNNTGHHPVLYMLHGYSGSYQEWMDYGLLNAAEDMWLAKTIKPFIIVLPLGEQGYWLNHSDGGPRWSDYFVFEVLRLVEANYRTIPNPGYRAIGGLSMGGHGALQLAFNYPSHFSIVGADSPSLRPFEARFDYMGDADYFATIDPISLAKVKNLAGYKIWIDIGQNDNEWVPRAKELDQILTSRNIPHSLNLWPGDHGYHYWSAHVRDYLTFYSNAFP